MRKLTLFLLLLLLSGQSIHAVSITVDHIDGLHNVDTLVTGKPIVFHLRLTNTDFSAAVGGMTNGFQVYSDDGAVWTPAVGDTVSQVPSVPDMFDLVSDIGEFGVTGFGADTIGFSCFRQDGTGLADGFDEVLFTITVELADDQDGKTICLDSAFYSPTGWWQWAYGGEVGKQYPDWAGAQCFTVLLDTDRDTVPDVVDNCVDDYNPDQADTDGDQIGDACDGCCVPPSVGDVDQSGMVDITDISVLIDNQFLSLTPLVCEQEGDVDFSETVDITDLSVLIDNQFLTLTPLSPCP